MLEGIVFESAGVKSHLSKINLREAARLCKCNATGRIQGTVT
jgi:hypothetical protein